MDDEVAPNPNAAPDPLGGSGIGIYFRYHRRPSMTKSLSVGHESFKTTAESYAQRDVVAAAQQRRVLGVLSGEKLAS